MHLSAADAWPRVAREHEGVCAWPYCDTRGLVTTGIGTLLDDGTGTPPPAFLALPWTTGGRPATRAQNAAGWLLTKSHTELAPKGGHAFRDVTTLRIDGKVIDGLLQAKTREFWSVLSAQLPGLQEWPADAQLALIDWAYQVGPWALGPEWPRFTAAAHADDFLGCAEHCAVRQASPARNQRRQRWFRNAALVIELELDPAVLWDESTPEQEDDDMPLSEDDLAKIRELLIVQSAADDIRIRELVQEEIDAALPRVWDSAEVDVLKVGADVIRPKTAVERIARKVGA